MQQPKRTKYRSEEHTSELQSLAYLVCRLLLEKKYLTGWVCGAWWVGRVTPLDDHHGGASRHSIFCAVKHYEHHSQPPASPFSRCFFFNDPATTEIYPLSLHEALPI